MKLNARQLRDLEDEVTVDHRTLRPMYLILDNIYDTYNIGGLFRLADALAMEKMYICGDSETPPNHKIKKASIGTYKIVPWEYKKTTLEAIEDVRSKKWVVEHGGPQLSRISDNSEEDLIGAVREQDPFLSTRIISIEQSPSSVPYTEFDFQLPLALIVGNETTGVSKKALDASDAIVEIPMHGVNKSLNVIVSAAIVGYHISSLTRSI